MLEFLGKSDKEISTEGGGRNARPASKGGKDLLRYLPRPDWI